MAESCEKENEGGEGELASEGDGESSLVADDEDDMIEDDDEYEYDYPYEVEDDDDDDDDVVVDDKQSPDESSTTGNAVPGRLHNDRRKWFKKRSSSLPIVDKPICKHCKRESHAPIQDCAVAAEWLERVEVGSSGVLTMHPRHVINAIYKRASDFADVHPGLQDQEAAMTWLRLNQWNEGAYEEDVAGGAFHTMANETRSFLFSTTASIARSAIPHAHRQRRAFSSCGICLEDDLRPFDVLRLKECDHTFCRDCFGQFITFQLQDNRGASGADSTFLACPAPECNTQIGAVQIRDLAPDLMPDFDEALLKSFIHHRRNDVRWCPGPDCSYVAVRSSTRDVGGEEQDDDNVVCQSCDTRFVFDSADNQGEEQFDSTDNQGEEQTGEPREEEIRKQRKYIRKCPSCEVPIEKNGGCNHMTCKCGHHFCWLCLTKTNTGGGHTCDSRLQRTAEHEDEDEDWLAPRISLLQRRRWLEHETEREWLVDHETALPSRRWRRWRKTMKPFGLEYICLTEDDDAETLQLVANVQDLERFRQCSHRYTAHHHGQGYAENQCERLERRQADFSNINRQDLKAANDSDFLKRANERLVACRRVLKYSHAFLYYYSAAQDEEHESPEITLFRTRQEQLGRFTEGLSGMSESAVSYLDRSKVLNLIGAVDRSLKALAVDAQLTPRPW